VTQDFEVEAALRRVRVAGPSPGVRTRALAAARRGARPRIGWRVAAAVAAAAAGAAWVLLPPPMPDLDAMDAERRQAVEATAILFGGGPGALRYAALVVPSPEEPSIVLLLPEVP